jgi:hypothetical protein
LVWDIANVICCGCCCCGFAGSVGSLRFIFLSSGRSFSFYELRVTGKVPINRKLGIMDHSIPIPGRCNLKLDPFPPSLGRFLIERKSILGLSTGRKSSTSGIQNFKATTAIITANDPTLWISIGVTIPGRCNAISGNAELTYEKIIPKVEIQSHCCR